MLTYNEYIQNNDSLTHTYLIFRIIASSHSLTFWDSALGTTQSLTARKTEGLGA